VKKAEITRQPNYDSNAGPDMYYFVDLYKDGDCIGRIDVSNKSSHYRQDVVENWENGILGEDNEYIRKFD
jgi:hypothetical protein